MPYLNYYTTGRDNNFKLLRVLAATLVLLSHSYPLTTGNNLTEPLNRLLGITLGSFAVHIFFFSSGFLVYASLLNRGNPVIFLKARVLRIYPALITSLLLCIIVCSFLTTDTLLTYLLNTTTIRFLSQNLDLIFSGSFYNLPHVFTDNAYPDAVNGSLWTLPYEFRMYLTLLILGVFSKNRHKLFTFIAIIISGSLLLATLNSYSTLIFSKTSLTLALFFYLGTISYQYKERIKLSNGYALLSILLLVVLIYLQLYFSFKLLVYCYPILLGYLTLYFVYIPKGILHKYNKLGDYSYGIYIYAFVIQQSFVALKLCRTPYTLFTYSFIPVLLLSILSWHYIEKPCMNLKK